MQQNFLSNTLFGYEFLENKKCGKIKREIRREEKPQLCKKHIRPITCDSSGEAVWNCFNLQLYDGGQEEWSHFYLPVPHPLSSLSGPNSSHKALIPLHLHKHKGSQDSQDSLELAVGWGGCGGWVGWGSLPAGVRGLSPCLLVCLRAWLGDPVQVLHEVPYLLMLEQQEESPGGRPVGQEETSNVPTFHTTWRVGVTWPNGRCSKDWPLLGRKYGSVSLFLGKTRLHYGYISCWCQVLILKGH